MADLYVSDSTFGKYRDEYADDAKAEMRSVLKRNAPGGDHAE